jgi:hypothetical protein
MFGNIDDESDGQMITKLQEEASKKCSASSSMMWRVLMAVWEAYTMTDDVLTCCWAVWKV